MCKLGGLMCGIWAWQSKIVKDLKDQDQDPKHTLFFKCLLFTSLRAECVFLFTGFLIWGLPLEKIERNFRVKEQLWKGRRQKTYFGVASVPICFATTSYFLFWRFWNNLDNFVCYWNAGDGTGWPGFRGSLHGNDSSRHLWLAAPTLKGFSSEFFLVPEYINLDILEGLVRSPKKNRKKWEFSPKILSLLL